MSATPAPVLALIAGVFTWTLTALGAAVVLARRDFPRPVLDAMLGFAAGVMIAAAFWSLLAPATEVARAQGARPWLVVTAGFLLGGFVLLVADQIVPHLHPFMKPPRAEGISTQWERSTLLVLAITLHNVPEGLAVGVAFGAAAHPLLGAGTEYAPAVALAVGIGLQNLPEGAAVAFPLRQAGVSRAKAFWYGQLSGVVEPVAAVLGALAVASISILLPYALAFAAGAMLYVVVEELIPEAQQSGRADLATVATLCGFALMTMLDLALG
ncbi:MAG: ZIP family metal transporter [Gemmatimonadota bacterium]